TSYRIPLHGRRRRTDGVRRTTTPGGHMEMPGHSSAGAASILALVVVAVAAHASSPIPLEHFADEPAIMAPALSPDGSKLAFIRVADGKRFMALFDLKTRDLKILASGETKDFRVTRCRFKTNERLLCSFFGTGEVLGKPVPYSRLVAIDADGANMKVLIQDGRAGGSQYQSEVLHWLPDDPRHVLVELDDDSN